ncbi:hypothetical protein TELCIR_21320, partial [Teladorsagia circumcincta]
AMVGTVVENLSNRKLLYILAALLITQIAFFLVGAWYAPVPSTSMEYEMIKCKDETRGESGKWFHIRPRHCDVIGDLSSYTPTSFDLREIVFVAQMPHMSVNRKSPNCQIGKVTSLRVVTIHQNGGFTQIWLWLKTLVFPVVAAAIWWYWNRIEKLARKPILLEKAIMTLGISLAVLDCK